MPEVRHSIKFVSLRTGLSPHVIRVWEKRYGTVTPGRSDGNRRLYRAADIDRFRLLKQATDAGHGIGGIARLPTEKLRRLVSEHLFGNAKVGVPASTPDADSVSAAARGAVVAMDGEALEVVLEKGSVALGQMRLISQVIVPLVERIGDDWRAGTLKVAHEHIATAAIRSFLGLSSRQMMLHPSAPWLVVGTPAGQVHEIGAVLAAAVARSFGWHVAYAGPSLPAEEIVSAALARQAVAVALSIVHPSDDPELPAELKRLRRLLPAGIHLVVGGRASAAYAKSLAACGASLVEDLEQWIVTLDRLRDRPV